MVIIKNRIGAKRLFDLVISIFGIFIIALPLLLLAWQVRQKLGSPVFFSQLRPGLNGQPFRMVKFRTMTGECDASGTLLPDAQRLTSFGRFLRATSLDELPELWNVLRGEMSLVGPRPDVPAQESLYTPQDWALRCSVRPGITGLAQVRYQYGASVDDAVQKLQYDLYYVKNNSLFLDLLILIDTVQVVLSGRGSR